MIEHLLETLPGNITLRVAVNRITHPHVISGDALSYRARGTACFEEMADNFLTGTDFGKSAIGRPIKIDG